MSGICGMVNFYGAPVDPDILDRMLAATGHRKPSVVRHWVVGNAGFACRQTDLWPAPSLAFSPPIGEGTGCVADARLDNRDEIRHRLRTGGWSTDEDATDAELILAVFNAWGERGLDCLQGAYAAAIWETGRQQLLLLRDRGGERVLYWCETPSVWLFASEPSQLLACGLVARDYNRQRILAHLIGAVPDPVWSFFRDISRLPEASYLKLISGRSVLHRYWKLDAIRVRHRTRAEAAEELAERLAAAVAARLPPAGETGLTLSGGLDSCSVAAAAADTLAARGKALHAFTWSSSQGDGIDERAVSSALIASRRNIVEHPVLADSLWPLSRYPDAWTDRNSPETNAYPDLLLATVEAALGKGVKALLNGLGGDPVIGWLTPDLSLLLRGRWLTLARRIGKTGIRGSGFVRQWRLVFGRRSLPQWLTAEGKAVALAAGLDAPAVPLSALLSPRGSRRRAISEPSNAAALERLDRLSRRLGLRMAAPWYDARLAALVLSLSDAAFSAALPMKGLLREAMVGHLPEAVRCATTVKETDSRLDRKGYLGGGRLVIEALLTRSRLADLGLVDADGIAAVYRRSVESGLIMSRLQTIVASECWLRTHESSILNFGDR